MSLPTSEEFYLITSHAYYVIRRIIGMHFDEVTSEY